jgi:serine/threonine protein kinase
MAEVYLARRRAAGVEKWLVVKRMRPETSGDPRFLELFVREARLSMSLVHQNIVPVFDFGKIDDQVFLAMERVEGKDLGSSLSRAKDHRLPPLLAAFIAAECCQALDYAHQRKSPDGVALGVVHRDVTPRNVLLSWSGEVKLTDFGIAALAGDATTRLLGTPHYMAPEQARSEPIDPRADIYAIGLVLREAITGTRPRPGGDRDAILEAARRGQLVPWSHLTAPDPEPPSVELAVGSGNLRAPPEPLDDPPPEALVAIIDRATAALPADRYPDARSMLEELDSFIVGQRAAHRAESPARQLATWLAGVWEGARDDVETSASIAGDHLVSFLDDGAHDVLGTGTIRSLAATAADATPPPQFPPSGPGAPVTATPAAGMPAIPSTATPAAGTPNAPSRSTPAAGLPLAARAPGALLARSGETAARLTKISSSNTTVASGSFHTLPTANPDGTAARSGEIATRRRKPRQIAPLARIVFVGLATGAVVFFFMKNRERNRVLPDQPSISQPTSSQPASGQPATEPPKTDKPTADQPATEPPKTDKPTAGQPATEPPNTGKPHAGQPNSGQPHTRPPHTGQPHIVHAGSGQANPSTDHAGSGSNATMPHDGGDHVKPAVCRVRINLTPWAYYSAEDGAHHETPSTIELAPGPHKIHVWNPQLHVERDITINVPADRDTMNYSEPLQPSTLPPAAGSSP